MKNSFFVLVILFLLNSCGLPDILPILDDPIFTTSREISVNQNLDGIFQYGLLIFYKHYDADKSPNDAFSNDVSAWRLRYADSPDIVATAIGFRLVTQESNPWQSTGWAPVITFTIPSNVNTWDYSFKFYDATTDSSPYLLDENGQQIILRRLVKADSGEVGKLFLKSSYLKTDADILSILRISNTSKLKVGFVIMAYGASFLYGNLYSYPVSLPIQEVNIQ